MAVVAAKGATEQGALRGLLTSGWFEAIPATLLLLLAAVLGLLTDQPRGALALDAAVFLTVALTGRFPRAAGVALGGCLALLLVVPSEWATLGEYASLIAVLGAGMRRRSRVRLAMVLGYGPLLMLITARDAPHAGGAVMGSVTWVVLLAVMWVVGSAFAAVVRAHESQRLADLVLQRQRLTHELHDTVARSLTVVVRLGERMQRSGTASPAELADLTGAAKTAHDQLRLVMDLLNDPVARRTPGPVGSSSLLETLNTGRALLEQHGFAPAIAVEGDFGVLSAEQSSVLSAAAEEAFANLVKHGDPAQPSAVVLRMTETRAELTTLNHPRTETGPAPAGALGVRGMRRRVAELGGTVSAERIGSQWQTRVLLPLATLPTTARLR